MINLKDFAYTSHVDFKVKSIALQDGYENDLIQEFEGKIIYRTFKENGEIKESKVVGELNGARLDLGEALNQKTHPWDIFDVDGDIAEYYSPFFSDGEYREELDLGMFGDFLIIHSVRVLPKYRGGYLGLLALRRAMKVFGGGCALAAIRPFPHQFENKVTPKNQAEVEIATRKLQNYWGLLGFRQCRDTEFYYFDLTCREPKLKIMSMREHVLQDE